jgi:hypothetical protein
MIGPAGIQDGPKEAPFESQTKRHRDKDGWVLEPRLLPFFLFHFEPASSTRQHIPPHLVRRPHKSKVIARKR